MICFLNKMLKEDIGYREMMLIAVLEDLSKKYGYCTATNWFLADRMGCNIDNVKRSLKKLEEKGYISRGNTKDPISKKVLLRKIFIRRKDLLPKRRKYARVKFNEHERDN